jgi:quercetin dioxygenase-like cupin family protein
MLIVKTLARPSLAWASVRIPMLMMLVCGAFLAPPAPAAEVVVTPLMTKELANIPGKEALMITVDYPPGGRDPIHRHNAHGFIYVLEGTIVMGVKGGKEVTLTKGQTFYEGPDDIHTVGRNASKTKPAKFMVLLIKDKDVPFFIPEK